MSVEFLEDAPDRIYPKRQNIYYEWDDGRKLVTPINQARIACARLERALEEYDTRMADVVPIPTFRREYPA